MAEVDFQHGIDKTVSGRIGKDAIKADLLDEADEVILVVCYVNK